MPEPTPLPTGQDAPEVPMRLVTVRCHAHGPAHAEGTSCVVKGFSPPPSGAMCDVERCVSPATVALYQSLGVKDPHCRGTGVCVHCHGTGHLPYRGGP